MQFEYLWEYPALHALVNDGLDDRKKRNLVNEETIPDLGKRDL